MEISKTDQERILRKLSSLPPGAMALHVVNASQMEILQVAAANYQTLRADFMAYFSGKKKPDFPYSLSKQQQDDIGLMRSYYLSWYTMAWEGWGYVERAAKKAGRDLPDEPGEAFTQMLEESCIAMCAYAFQESCTLAENRTRKLLKDSRDLERRILSARGIVSDKSWEIAELAKETERHLARVTKESKNLGIETDTQSRWLYTICRRNRHHSIALGNAVANFEHNRRTLLHTVEKKLHPRKTKPLQRLSLSVPQGA